MVEPSVLVVEDNLEIQSFLQNLLEIKGFVVTLAEDGIKGLQRLTQCKPDVIITDVMMPELDGLEFIRQVRKREGFAHTPIVAISGYGANYQPEPYQAGATVFIHKPIEGDRLIETLNILLNRILPKPV